MIYFKLFKSTLKWSKCQWAATKNIFKFTLITSWYILKWSNWIRASSLFIYIYFLYIDEMTNITTQTHTHMTQLHSPEFKSGDGVQTSIAISTLPVELGFADSFHYFCLLVLNNSQIHILELTFIYFKLKTMKINCLKN
jgi:hypothetical protein